MHGHPPSAPPVPSGSRALLRAHTTLKQYLSSRHWWLHRLKYYASPLSSVDRDQAVPLVFTADNNEPLCFGSRVVITTLEPGLIGCCLTLDQFGLQFSRPATANRDHGVGSGSGSPNAAVNISGSNCNAPSASGKDGKDSKDSAKEAAGRSRCCKCFRCSCFKTSSSGTSPDARHLQTARQAGTKARMSALGARRTPIRASNNSKGLPMTSTRDSAFADSVRPKRVSSLSIDLASSTVLAAHFAIKASGVTSRLRAAWPNDS